MRNVGRVGLKGNLGGGGIYRDILWGDHSSEEGRGMSWGDTLSVMKRGQMGGVIESGCQGMEGMCSICEPVFGGGDTTLGTEDVV